MQSILVCGIGTIGSNVTLNLWLNKNQLDYKFTCIDYDTVENKNLPTQVYDASSIGFNKGDALKSTMYLMTQTYPENINTVNIKIDTEIDGFYDLTIDCLDNYEARNFVLGDNLIDAGQHRVFIEL